MTEPSPFWPCSDHIPHQVRSEWTTPAGQLGTPTWFLKVQDGWRPCHGAWEAAFHAMKGMTVRLVDAGEVAESEIFLFNRIEEP